MGAGGCVFIRCSIQIFRVCHSLSPKSPKVKELRLLLAATEDPEEIWRCKRRIAELTPMLTQMNELAELTAHYYDRGYYRNEKYTV